MQTPIALLGALMTLPGGSAGALSAVRLLARNLPLVLQLVMIGMLFWPTKEGERLQDEHDALRTPNGPDDRPRAQHFATLMHDCRGGRGIVAPPETLGWAKATLLETSQGVAASGAPPILGHAARRNRLDRVKAPAVIPGKGERPAAPRRLPAPGAFASSKRRRSAVHSDGGSPRSFPPWMRVRHRSVRRLGGCFCDAAEWNHELKLEVVSTG